MILEDNMIKQILIGKLSQIKIFLKESWSLNVYCFILLKVTLKNSINNIALMLELSF